MYRIYQVILLLLIAFPAHAQLIERKLSYSGGGGGGTSVYNVDDTGGDAWYETNEASSSLWTNLADVDASNYSAGNETTISTDDTNSVTSSIGQCWMGPPTAARMAHRYKFAVAESEGSITNLTPTVKFEASAAIEGSGTIALYIWDSTNTEWDSVDSEASWSYSTTYTLTSDISSNITDYVDGSGDVYLMLFWGNTDCSWDLYAKYAELSVDYDAVSDTTPDAFSFADDTDVLTSTLTTSDIIQITGMDDGTDISIAGDGTPAYRICSNSDCSSETHTWSSSSGSIDANEYAQLRLTSNASNSTMNSATLTIGTESDQWDVTTEAGGPTDTYLDPDGDGATTDWSTAGTCTGGDYGCINDETRDPTTPDKTNYLYGSGDDAATIHTFDTVSGVGTVTQVDILAHAEATSCAMGCADISVEISNDNGSSWETPQAMDLCGNGFAGASGWVTSSWTGLSWNQTQLDNIQARFTRKNCGMPGSGSWVYLYSTYSEITY